MRSVIIDHYYDQKFGGIETGEWYLVNDHGLHQDGNRYQPTPYPKLKAMLEYLRLSHEDTFVDLGAGKGRVLFVVATQPVNKVIGVEVDRELAEIARANLAKLRGQASSIEILNVDAAAFCPSGGTVFFMFNPFREQTIAKVIENVKASVVENPRAIRFVYYSPMYRYLFDAQEWLIPEGEIRATKIFVWRNRFPEPPIPLIHNAATHFVGVSAVAH